MGRSYASTYWLSFFVLFAFLLSRNGVHAFGAGNIPSFAYMEGRAFRHGDIEDVLADLIKKGGSGFALANIITKSKFNGLDIKRVYFGNWLRDYSQAVDIASLKKIQIQTILNLCMVLGFMAHGYATHEFEVTAERLGCYLPTEHIDNPKGYGGGEDPRKYHPGLRGPVDPRELEIDPRSGLKNYIANENGHWDTSKALVRRTLERCIHLGRQQRAQGQKQDEYEAYRLLGQLLHTLEDFPAHSNFCELALVSMGHQQVFVHVGDNVRIQAPNGRWVAPIVTGTFGSDDFIHSLLGEATDHLSSASVSDINKELDKARSRSMSNTRGPGGSPADPADTLRDLFQTIPGGGDSELSRDLDNINRIRAGPAAGGKRPEDMSPQELHSVLWQVLTFRDSVVKKISKTIEKIPGLGPLIEKIMDGISIFVFTTLEPFLKPIIKAATSGLTSASGEVIDNHDQYEVFNDPRASDPTHSFLSKDHFNLILNEPAGQLARIIVVHTVKAVINAWDNNSVNVHQVTEEILQCLFHPDFHNPKSLVQREMLQLMKDWISKTKNQGSVLQRLTKQAVRNHENLRLAGEGGAPAAEGTYAAAQGHQFQNQLLGQAQQYLGSVPGFPGGGAHGHARDGSGAGAAGFPGAVSHGHSPAPAGHASSYYSDDKHQGPPGGGYAPPGHAPPQSQHGGYGPPSGAPPSTNTPHAGYAPTYGGSAPSFPGGGSSAPSFPGGASSAPSFPGAAPGFPGAPGGYGDGSHGHSHSSPPPSFPGAPGGYAPPPTMPSSSFGFPDAEDGGFGGPSPMQFPGAGPPGGAPGQGHGGYNPGYGGGGW
ncbi:heterokaryon incompatibility protein Het-C-domain-containing protein [Crepidotus variabilis]|uniref:Heterokaryon incompatibility protein Het-C-domain-containing protein n=1 Tax=Crepidotus variabilis TaxID=179855 RepID=A0A9P6E9Q7_9AGAR|nr:heterokaryon incompatibility protein Het-C-domain-containing protein [Crepidotus variabilis]